MEEVPKEGLEPGLDCLVTVSIGGSMPFPGPAVWAEEDRPGVAPPTPGAPRPRRGAWTGSVYQGEALASLLRSCSAIPR